MVSKTGVSRGSGRATSESRRARSKFPRVIEITKKISRKGSNSAASPKPVITNVVRGRGQIVVGKGWSEFLSTDKRSMGRFGHKTLRGASGDREQVLAKIAEQSLDLFSTKEEALEFIRTLRFGPSGKTASELLGEGREESVRARLDELRFGVNS